MPSPLQEKLGGLVWQTAKLTAPKKPKDTIQQELVDLLEEVGNIKL